MYTSIDSIVKDILIMFSNCVAYNEPDSDIYIECIRQKYQFRSFMIREMSYPIPDDEPEIRRSSRSSKQITYYSDQSPNPKEQKTTSFKKRSQVDDIEYKKPSLIENSNIRKSTQRIDPELKRQMLAIVSLADEIDSKSKFFEFPVDFDSAPGYCDIIEKPLDISTIRFV